MCEQTKQEKALNLLMKQGFISQDELFFIGYKNPGSFIYQLRKKGQFIQTVYNAGGLVEDKFMDCVRRKNKQVVIDSVLFAVAGFGLGLIVSLFV